MNGLGIGDEDGENRYRLVQTKAPDRTAHRLETASSPVQLHLAETRQGQQRKWL